MDLELEAFHTILPLRPPINTAHAQTLTPDLTANVGPKDNSRNSKRKYHRRHSPHKALFEITYLESLPKKLDKLETLLAKNPTGNNNHVNELLKILISNIRPNTSSHSKFF